MCKLRYDMEMFVICPGDKVTGIGNSIVTYYHN